MKTIKGKIGFILAISIISLSIIIIFSVYVFHKQNQLTKEIQDIDVILTDSKSIEVDMLKTRFEQEQYLRSPSEGQAEILINSIEKVRTNAESFAETYEQYEEVSTLFLSIAENARIYKGEIDIVANLYNRIGYNNSEGERKYLLDQYENLYTLIENSDSPELMNMLLQLRLYENIYINQRDDAALDQFNDIYWTFKDSIGMQGLNEEAAAELDSAVVDYRMAMVDLKNSLNQTTKNQNQFSTIAQKVQDEIYEVNLAVEGIKIEKMEEQEETGAIISALLITIGAIVLLLLVITGLFLMRNILKSIRTLKQGAERMGNGDLSYRVEITGKDEMAELAQTFNQMANKMEQSLLKVWNASKILGDSSSNLTEISQNSSLQTNEISAAINQVAVGAQEQASQIEESTNLIEQVEDAIEKTEGASLDILNALNNAENDSKLGIEKIKDLEETSDSFIRLARHLSNEVKEATEQSKKINTIVSTIQEIADNTNLLALNAAIESARAGENGRGFAVVADEVRKLAERSKTEAEEIFNLIKQMMNQMNSLSEEAEKFDVYQKEQMKSVDDTKNTFSNISKQVYDINDRMEGVISSVRDISSAKDTLKQKIHEISVISEESVATAEEVAASSEHQTESMEQLNGAAQNLHALSQELQAEVNGFHLNEDNLKEVTESEDETEEILDEDSDEEMVVDDHNEEKEQSEQDLEDDNDNHDEEKEFDEKENK